MNANLLVLLAILAQRSPSTADPFAIPDTPIDDSGRPQSMGPLEDALPVYVGEPWDEASARMRKTDTQAKSNRGPGFHTIGANVHRESSFGTVEYVEIGSRGDDIRVSQIAARIRLTGGRVCSPTAIKRLPGTHWTSWKLDRNKFTPSADAVWPGERTLHGACFEDVQDHAMRLLLITLKDSWLDLPTKERSQLVSGKFKTAGRLVTEVVISWVAALSATGEKLNEPLLTEKVTNEIQDALRDIGEVGKLSARARQNFSEYRVFVSNMEWIREQIRLGITEVNRSKQ